MSVQSTDDHDPEFSRIINLGELEKDAVHLDITADAEECAALAKRFGLSAIASLHVTGTLERLGRGRVRLRAKLNSEVTQTCVVTLDPLVNRIEEDLDILFDPAHDDSEGSDVAFDPASDREPLIGDSLDVGEIVAEELAVALDPYPRKPGIALEMDPNEGGGTQPEGGPFEALAVLKRKD
jgi:uncharacterized metal-binding protein YceD (DUF177 family)